MFSEVFPRKLLLSAFAVILTLSVIMLPRITQADDDIVIGTGGPSGVYYPLGKAICAAINNRYDETGFRCRAINTAGSVENVKLLHSGEIDFGLVQSDVQFFAIKGIGHFKEYGPMKDLRAVLGFYPEALTIVTRPDTGIVSFSQLKGKRVVVGTPGSGHHTTMDLLTSVLKWNKADTANFQETSVKENAGGLCDKKIDAFAFMAGNPNDLIKSVADRCDIQVVKAFNRTVQRLIQKYPYFGPVRVSDFMYDGLHNTAATIGVFATLMTTQKANPRVVTEVMKSIFIDFIDLRFSNTVLKHLDMKKMVQVPHAADYHDSALKFLMKTGNDPKVDKVRPAR